MGSEVVALISTTDEGAQFDVFPHPLLGSGIETYSAHTVHHTVKSHLGGVGDVREDGVFHVTVNSLYDGGGEEFAQSFALSVDVAVGATAEVYPFKRACPFLLRLKNLLGEALTVVAYSDSLTRLEFVDGLSRDVEGSLDDRALTRYYHHLVVLIPEGRSDAPRVADGKHLARARHATHYVASVKIPHGALEHVARLHVVVYIAGDVCALQSASHRLVI